MIVGLTGGIGSGKTTVANLFFELGVPVYVSDIEAKKLMITDTDVINEIKNILGEDAYLDKKLNRSYISDKVFTNKSLLEELNAIVHPVVAKDFIKWYNKQDSPYVIKESAILFESGSDRNCDLIITVTAPLEERINRVVLRDNISKKKVSDRVLNQFDDEDKIQKSNFIIHNIELEETKKQVIKINNQILNKIRKKHSF